MNRSKWSDLTKHFLVDKIDETLALLGLTFTFVLTVWLALSISHPTFIATGALLFLAFAGYLVIKKSLRPSTLPTLASAEGSLRLHIGLSASFFLLFVYSVFSLLLRPDPYTRPLGYFVAVALMVAIIAVEILFLPSNKWCSYSVLFRIVLVASSLEFSQLLIFPNVVGIDPWWHQMFTLSILKAGYVPGGYAYSQLPLMHLMTGETSLLTGLDYKMATMLSISLSQIFCNVLFTSLLGSLLFNNKVGLLGGLLIGVANEQIWAGYWTIPTTMASVFILAILYLLLKARGQKQHVATFLAILLMGALILTHTVTAACMAILLFAFWIGFRIHNRISRGRTRWEAPVTLVTSVLFAAGTLSWWSYASGDISTLTELIKWGFSRDYFLQASPKEIIQYVYKVPFSEQLLNVMGTVLFLALSLIGCLYMISKFGNSHSFAFAIGGSTILILTLFAPLTGLSFIEERWYYFSQILLSLPLSLALFLSCQKVKSRLGKAVFLAVIAFSLSFLMITSPSANIDNPTLSPNTEVRYAVTESELQAIFKVSQMWNGKVGVDQYYADPWLPWQQRPVESIDEQIYTRNFTDCHNLLVLIREEIVNHPFMLFQRDYKLDYDPREVLAAQGFSRVYDCGSVSGFVCQEGEPTSAR